MIFALCQLGLGCAGGLPYSRPRILDALVPLRTAGRPQLPEPLSPARGAIERAPERARAPAVLGRPRWPTWVLPVNRGRGPQCFARLPWAPAVPGRAGLERRKRQTGTYAGASLGYQIRPPDQLDPDPNSPEVLPGISPGARLLLWLWGSPQQPPWRSWPLRVPLPTPACVCPIPSSPLSLWFQQLPQVMQGRFVQRSGPRLSQLLPAGPSSVQ